MKEKIEDKNGIKKVSFSFMGVPVPEKVSSESYEKMSDGTFKYTGYFFFTKVEGFLSRESLDSLRLKEWVYSVFDKKEKKYIVEKKVFYNHLGECVGKCSFKNGQKKTAKFWKDGNFEEHYEDGKVAYRVVSTNGTMISENFYPNGNCSSRTAENSKQVKKVTFNEDGQQESVECRLLTAYPYLYFVEKQTEQETIYGFFDGHRQLASYYDRKEMLNAAMAFLRIRKNNDFERQNLVRVIQAGNTLSQKKTLLKEYKAAQHQRD